MLGLLLLFTFLQNFMLLITELFAFNANSVDPDQKPAFDLGLHCLPMSLCRDVRIKWLYTFMLKCILLSQRSAYAVFNNNSFLLKTYLWVTNKNLRNI